jgi:hypothetical protein
MDNIGKMTYIQQCRCNKYGEKWNDYNGFCEKAKVKSVTNANTMEFIHMNVHLWLVINLYLIINLVSIHFYLAFS